MRANEERSWSESWLLCCIPRFFSPYPVLVDALLTVVFLFLVIPASMDMSSSFSTLVKSRKKKKELVFSKILFKRNMKEKI